MVDSSGSPPPGWYHAAGDPLGTQRYWDGTQWASQPVWMAQPQQPTAWTPGYLPEIGQTLAGPWQRVVARILDGLILAAVLLIPVMIWLVQSDGLVRDGEFRQPDFRIGLLGAVIGAAYEITFVALKGATPGKMAMGIMIIRQDGTAPPGWSTSALRYVLDLIGVVPGLGGLAMIVLRIISFVFLFTDDRRRTIPDRIATTYVVKARPANW